MKNLNLLPSHIRYDYSRLLVIKLMVFAVAVNVIFLSYVVGLEMYHIKVLKGKIAEKKNYYTEIQKINAQFGQYETEYLALKKSLNVLKQKEQAYFLHFKMTYSPLVSTMIYLQTIRKGIVIKTADYSDGKYTITGEADSSKDFYRYYKQLELNEELLDLSFYHYQSNTAEDHPGFEFKLKFAVRKLDEAF